MKKYIIIVLLVMICQVLPGPAVQEAKAAVYPSLYYTQAELDNYKALIDIEPYSTVFNNIKTWADTTLTVPLPEHGDVVVNAKIKRFIGTMVFMYHMTDDTSYAQAAKNWMLEISTWPDWIDGGTSHWQGRSGTIYGVSNGYYGLYDYLTESERAIIRDKLIIETNIIYGQYSPFGLTYFPSGYPNHESTVGAAVGLAALTLEGEYSGTSDWMDFSMQCVDRALGLAGQDGGWFEGPSYFRYSMLSLVPYMDILRRHGGRDLFTEYRDFLEDAAYYPIYLTAYDGVQPEGTPMQMEDCTGTQGWHQTIYEVSLDFLYKLASEYNNGYAQTAANNLAYQNRFQTFLWLDTSIEARPFSELPLQRYFRDIGYVIWKDGWDNDDMTFIFKSGRSMGHSHSDQNSYTIYKGGRPLTSGPGYGIGSGAVYDLTWTSNSITIGDDVRANGLEYGLGQGQEYGDLGMLNKVGYQSRGDPPISGIIEEVATNNYYSYARGDASAVYKDIDRADDEWSNNHPWPGLVSSSELSEFTRHFVYIDNPGYFVMYDELADSDPERFNWFFHGRNLYNESADLSLNSDLITYSKGNEKLEIELVEPTAYNYDIRHEDGYRGHKPDWDYIMVWPQTEANSARFLSVITVDDSLSTGELITEGVNQGNCTGVIVTYGDYKDLILFSRDGNPVNEYIELSGYFQTADGNSYTFSGTRILANFNTYQVLRLRTLPGDYLPVITFIQTIIENMVGRVEEVIKNTLRMD